jgi:hypothetical protein
LERIPSRSWTSPIAASAFINDRNIRLTHYVTGELLFLSGEAIRVEGILKWEKSHMYGLYMKDQIPADTLARELHRIQDAEASS